MQSTATPKISPDFYRSPLLPYFHHLTQAVQTITPLTKLTSVNRASSARALIVATRCIAAASLKKLPTDTNQPYHPSPLPIAHYSHVPDLGLPTANALLALTLAPKLPKFVLMEIFWPLAGMRACTAVLVLSWESWTWILGAWGGVLATLRGLGG